MKLEWQAVTSAAIDLRALADCLEYAARIVEGRVDATVAGYSFGKELTPEQKRVLQDLALQPVAEKMISIIRELNEACDITFIDDQNSPVIMFYDLINMYKRRLDQAAADTPPT